MSIADRITAKLSTELAPARLELADESARHAGHAGTRGLATGETHFRLTVVSPRFAGQSRVQRQRLVHRILAEELAGQVHALALTALTPEEAEAGR